MEKRVAFLNLGCKVNSYETEAMREQFMEAGYQVVEFKDIADVYVVNTCTVTNIADRKSRQMLHQAKKRNEDAVVIATGCYVQASEEALLEDSAVDIVIGNNRKGSVVKMVSEYLSKQNKQELVIDINHDFEYEELNLTQTLDKTRAFIKVQDGCNRFCAYCIIPYVRGRARSRKVEDVIREVTELSKKGFKEVVLTGIHLSSYGIDFEKNKEEKLEQDVCPPLGILIEEVAKIEGIERIRLGSLEPMIITKDFVEKIASIPQFCPHFHLSLQSGCDETLKRMNRRYTVEEFYQMTELLRKYFKDPAFTTDVIVGFPGETEEEFRTTCDFVKKVHFAGMHVFRYSVRKGTKAEKMENQVPEEIKAHRSNELTKIAEQMSEEYKALFVGRIEKILLEEEITVDDKEYFIGHNERYQKMAIINQNYQPNEILQVKVIRDLTKDILLCEISD